MENTIKTALLLGALTALFLYLGSLAGGDLGMAVAFVIAVSMNLGSYWFSDRVVLRIHRAREVGPQEAPALHRVVETLCARANLPKPKVYLIPRPQPNAFATGRDPEHAAVAVTEGILQLLSPDELEGVLAHELAHVKHRDILIASVAATLAGAIMIVSHMVRWAAIAGGRRSREQNGVALLVAIVVAPLAAAIIQLAISRSREYSADAEGADLSGNPLGLANALRKLETSAERSPMDGSPATAHMFIVNPFTRGGMSRLFSTHPPTELRIERLEAMAGIVPGGQRGWPGRG